MARLKETLGVLKGLREVSVAYSVEVSRELSQLAAVIPSVVQNQFDLREERNQHGLPDDFPGWENFKSGEFGLGAEYESQPSPPLHDPPSDPRQSPPGTPSDTLNGGHQRSFHTLSSRQLLPFGQVKTVLRHSNVSKTPRRFTSSGDTVVGSTPTGDEADAEGQTEKSHIEQQKMVG